jgi:CO dehydrogenase maturation factor
MQERSVDLALLVTEPSPRSIEVARRAGAVIATRKIGPALVVANKVRGGADVARVRAELPGLEVVVVPEDAEVLRADREALAPIDLAPGSPAVRAVGALARRLSTRTGP